MLRGDAAQITRNGTALTVYTYTLPASTLAIRVTVGYSHSTGTGSVSYALNPNGQTVAASSNATTGSIVDIHSIPATGSTTGIRVTVSGNSPAQGLASTLTGLAVTSSPALTFAFTAASTERVTPIEWVCGIDSVRGKLGTQDSCSRYSPRFSRRAQLNCPGAQF